MKTKEINSKENSNKKATMGKNIDNKKENIISKVTKTIVQKTINPKVETPKKKSASKKTSSVKSTATKNTTVKKSTSKKTKKTVSQKSSKRKTTSKKSTTKKVSNNQAIEIVEYYDLPYRYNETIVKILYQTPNTLFVYWDISDEDRENYIKEYGKNFFNITRPVLIVHNETMNYSFEVPINDFANSWYLKVNDSKCNYKIELGRRPNYYSEEAANEIKENIHTDYIYVSTSNQIEAPNDHVLFATEKNSMIKFRNIKNQKENSISLFDIVKRLPVMKNNTNIPYIREEVLKNIYSSIYENEDITFFDKISNPSSGNPSSGNIHSRI